MGLINNKRTTSSLHTKSEVINFKIIKLRSNSDTSNFSSYPDSDKQPTAIKKAEDPFISWGN